MVEEYKERDFPDVFMEGVSLLSRYLLHYQLCHMYLVNEYFCFIIFHPSSTLLFDLMLVNELFASMLILRGINNNDNNNNNNGYF